MKKIILATTAIAIAATGAQAKWYDGFNKMGRVLDKTFSPEKNGVNKGIDKFFGLKDGTTTRILDPNFKPPQDVLDPDKNGLRDQVKKSNEAFDKAFNPDRNGLSDSVKKTNKEFKDSWNAWIKDFKNPTVNGMPMKNFKKLDEQQKREWIKHGHVTLRKDQLDQYKGVVKVNGVIGRL